MAHNRLRRVKKADRPAPVGYVRGTPTTRTDWSGWLSGYAPDIADEVLERVPEHGFTDKTVGDRSGLYPLAQEQYDDLARLGIGQQFLSDITPSLKLNLGVYSPFKKTSTCCNDGRLMECTAEGSRWIFGLQAEVALQWDANFPVSTPSDGGCPQEGHYTHVFGGPKVKGSVSGVSGKIEIEIGLQFNPDGSIFKYGSASGSVSLPAGLGLNGKAEVTPEGQFAAAAKATKKIKIIGAGAGVGGLNTFTVTGKDLQKCCSSD